MADGQKKKKAPLPTKQQILDFVRESPTPVGKREIARAFQITGADRIPLKAMLKELERDGQVDRGRKRRIARPGALPNVAVVQVTGIDPDGEVLARPVAWPADAEPPRIYMAPDRPGTPALGRGDRVLARLARTGEDVYEGRTIRRLAGAPKRVLGIYERGPDGDGRLRPTDRRVKTDFRVATEDADGAEPGELVQAEVLHTHRLGWLQARVVERLGRLGDARSISLISIHEHDIPTEFSPEALEQAEAAQPVALGNRTDLREVPLVTIDGADARDFDDAVWAAPDDDPRNRGGWRLLVAIADVSHYVRPGDPLDRAAYERGNSAYFPDRVVPMLPEALSNGLCSLKPKEERPCLAVEMIIDREGKKRRHRFIRGLMRSAARLTYEQVQQARDGAPDDMTGPLVEPVIAPLYNAFAALQMARERRGTLELDIAERRVILGEDGHVERIEPRLRLDSHKLIEEFMIAANVAAAETLEEKRQPAMYRVHDAPDPVKIEALRQFLDSLGLSLARGQVIRPKTFTQLLERVAGTPYAAMVNELVLRSQAQAVYAPENIGHFGLALPRYAHFTSPIRRYADLLVHRALVSGCSLGEGGLTPEAGAGFTEIGAHISMTERRAAAAERDAVDRYTAAFLADKVGAVFHGRINGVTRFGLFVTLLDSGADGLVPISTLPADFYDHDEARHALVGRRWGRVYSLGDPVEARLMEAEPVTGGLILQLDEDGAPSESAASGAKPPLKARPRRKGAAKAGTTAAARKAVRKKAKPDKTPPGKTGPSGKRSKAPPRSKSGKATPPRPRR
ncbi:ribonuclease R [Rhodospirillaceae bacterium SYSU D60014]|uniref:ribonuclease R n=1 Tax=Virgifigura deserti TaxID=2268457 RepID=UPI000E66F062